MDDILPLIKSRRNIPEFLPKDLSWDQVSKIIDAGRHAPSSGNLQNWKFIVVRNPDKRHKVAEISMDQYEISVAPVHIVVCAEPEKTERYYGIRGEKLYTIQNCAAAIENMLLEATSLGLGCRWIGAFHEDKLKDLLSIPPEIRPQAIIAIGYPKFIPPKPPKYPLEPITYFEKWRNRVTDPDKYFGNYSAVLARNLQGAQEGVTKAAKFVAKKAEPGAKSFADKMKDKWDEQFAKRKAKEKKRADEKIE
jgi:nitroreductase